MKAHPPVLSATLVTATIPRAAALSSPSPFPSEQQPMPKQDTPHSIPDDTHPTGAMGGAANPPPASTTPEGSHADIGIASAAASSVGGSAALEPSPPTLPGADGASPPSRSARTASGDAAGSGAAAWYERLAGASPDVLCEARHSAYAAWGRPRAVARCPSFMLIAWS